MTVRTRFAPSPTGYLHIGGLRTALYTYLFTRGQGGAFILRIEDTDQQREVEGAVDKIYASMAAAGLDYDEGPNVGGNFGPYIQSERRDIYKKYAEELVEKGGAYYCFCSKERLDDLRAEYEGRGDTFKYDKHCLHLSPEEIQRRVASGESYVIRQNMPTEGKVSFDDALYGHIEVDADTLDDTVLLKSDGLPTYNFANVVDDHLMGITHVMRGTEYLSSTPKYNNLYEGFGWEKPVYIHLPPVMKDQHRKLSKRHGDPSFEDLLEQGYLQEAIINYIALLGWSPGTDQEFFTVDALKRAFSLDGLSKSPAIFDTAKLTWFNFAYIRDLPEAEYDAMARAWLENVLSIDTMDYRRLCSLLQPRTECFAQLPELVDFLAEMPDFSVDLYTHKKMKTDPAIAQTSLEAVLPVLEGVASWTEADIHAAVSSKIEEMGIKNGQMLWPLRIAIAGKQSTPGGATEIAYLLGKDETLRRLRASLAKLNG